VLELNATNFDVTVYNQPKAHFVKFYASWCGHCLHYKSTWSKFATNLKEWSDFIQVSAVDCAPEETSSLCREHSIVALPTLKYFKAGAKSKEDAEVFHGNKYNLTEMTRIVAGLVHKDYEANKPVGWPKLEPAKSSLPLSDLWSDVPTEASILALVVDNSPYGDGFATLINYHKNPEIHVILVDSAHPLAVQFGKTFVPAIHIFKRDNKNLPSYSSKETMNFEKIMEQVDKFIGHSQGSSQKIETLHPNSEIEETVNWQQFEVQYLDLTSTLTYMLTQEIPRRNVIDGVYLKVLKDWIQILRKYLPLDPAVRQLFYKLDDYLEPLHNLTAEDWLTHVKEYQVELENPLPATASYLACKGSKPYLRGYNCGLWTLFHTLTVQAYKQNVNNPSYNPYSEILEPLHQFVLNYLSCEECAKHFDKTAKETLNDVKSHEDTILWLWKAHNKANKRLSGDSSEDPKFLKHQFPSANLCKTCYLSSGEFNEIEVLSFLIQYYSDIKADEVQDDDSENTGHQENVSNLPYNEVKPQVATRKTFYSICLVIVALLLAFIGLKCYKNNQKGWKKFY